MTTLDDAQRLVDSLNSSRADLYSDWIAVGMALQSEFGDEAKPLWESFSQRSEKFKEGECETKWKSFNGNGGRKIGYGTLVEMAKQDGYTPSSNGNGKPASNWQTAKPKPAQSKPAKADLGKPIREHYYNAGRLKKSVYAQDSGKKTCRWYHTDDGVNWKPGYGGNQPDLYKVDWLKNSDPAYTVYLSESEKDADSLEKIGALAVSHPGGASEELKPDYIQLFAGRRVAILVHNDEPGIEWAEKAAKALEPVALVRIITPQAGGWDFKAGGDVADALESGLTLAKLEEIAEQAEIFSAEQPEEGSGWPWRGLDDILAPIQPVDYLVAGMIPRASVTLVFGADGSLKSMLAMDCAVCVATGKPWLVGLPDKSRNAFETKQANVLWYDADNGEDLVRERLRAMYTAHQVKPGNLHYISFPDPIFDASDDVSISNMIDDIKRFNAELVIFDNLSTISGSIDENSPEMQKVMTRLKRIAEETRAAIILIHHATKAGGGYRGHGRIRQACDLALKVERRTADDPQVNVTADKIRRVPVKPFGALFTYDNQGEQLAAARFFGADYQSGDSGKPPKTEALKPLIKAILKESPGMNQSEIVKELEGDADRKTIRASLDELVKNGELRQKPGAKNSVTYQLPS